MASVLIVSLVSLAGIVTLAFDAERLKKILLYLVSFAAGALLGDVFLHILPEMGEEGFPLEAGIYILAGIITFFALERFAWWHGSHGEHSEEVHSMTYMTITGDTLHNFIDGMIIATAYLVSVPLGVATTAAVVLHEIPQELGNFAVLVHGGWSRKKALLYNFLSALAAVVGAAMVVTFFRGMEELPVWLIAVAASSFIYIAMSDLIPEIHKEKRSGKSLALMLCIVLGVLAMGLLLLLE